MATEIETVYTDDFVTTADRADHPTLPPLTMERGGDLKALKDLLNQQHAAKFDTVVSASRLRYQDGKLVVLGALEDNPAITLDGVSNDLTMAPTAICEDQVASRLGIPQLYVRKMRGATHEDEFGGMVSLLDRNVNAWLAQDPGRLFTVRGFYDANTGDGIARALMSGRYELLDNLDQLNAVLRGLARVAESNPNVDPSTLNWKVDLTERTMRVRLIAPQIAIMAPVLLEGYRDPWNGRYSGSTGDTPPIIQAGLDIRNSETGSGRFKLVPFLHVLACTNGLTVTHESVHRTHLGGMKLEGRINYSVETQRKVLEAVTAQTADAVASFLSEEWLQAQVDALTADATTPVADAKGTLEVVSKAHKLTDPESEAIFELFLRSGQDTAGGVAQAITAHAHAATPNRAMELDDMALAAMATAAKHARKVNA